ncbi:TetR/AcrR family transcriptional regulator [Sphingobacteriaceae bacterium WQ 2009]|uniref:TetR/AcrR family transcriptional regulator n=1 Tax=Rhinopithecimicrobium faecis TaxID=2820698 RepID=A0A8T4HCH7_9SPHI|nr:TetR/AcrR family transcriptional regulator [Sphingobacteriaceae bacterium WQ 2009]
MTIAARKLRQQEELKKSILEASWEIVVSEGWAALSIRRIAEAIEYSVPVVYKHFENKDAIVEYFTLEGFRLLAKDLTAAVDNQICSKGKIQSIAQAYWNFAVTHQKHYEIMFGLGIPKCEVVNSAIEMKTTVHIMISVIEEAIAKNNKKDVDSLLKFKTFWSILHGIVAIELLSNTAINQEPSPILKEAIDGYISSFIN